MRYFILLPLFLLLFSCRKEDRVTPSVPELPPLETANYRTYTIEKGAHSSTIGFRIFSEDKMAFKALFDSSAVYTTVDPKNKFDINKLFGFSDCNSLHQENSARFGWRWGNNALQIFAYCYSNGERTDTLIKSVSIGEPHDFTILVFPDKYTFTVDSVSVDMKRGCATEKASGYFLYPYFGGDETAPHKIQVKIDEE